MPSGIYQHKKGKVLSSKWRENLSNALKGRKAWNKGLKAKDHPGLQKSLDAARKAVIGKPAWNKGKKMAPHTEEWKKKVSATKRANPIPEHKHSSWKGDEASCAAMHRWVEKWKGKPNACEMCGKTELTAQQIHWANIDHKYKRVLEDYIRLCTKCHGSYDSERGMRNHKPNGLA